MRLWVERLLLSVPLNMGSNLLQRLVLLQVYMNLKLCDTTQQVVCRNAAIFLLVFLFLKLWIFSVGLRMTRHYRKDFQHTSIAEQGLIIKVSMTINDKNILLCFRLLCLISAWPKRDKNLMEKNRNWAGFDVRSSPWTLTWDSRLWL